MSQALTEEQRQIIDTAFRKHLDFIGEDELHQIARSVLFHLKNPSDRVVDFGLNIPFAGASTEIGNRELTAQSFARSYQLAIKEIGDDLGYPDYSEEQLVRNAMRERALEIYKERIKENQAKLTALIKGEEVAFERQKKSWLSGGGVSYLIRGKQDDLLMLVEGLLIPDVNKDKMMCTRNRDSGLWTIKVINPVDDLMVFVGLASESCTQRNMGTAI